MILSFGCLIHLLLDSLQEKWAGSVILFAPFNWERFRLGLFWPESFPTYTLTLFGLLYIIFLFREGIKEPLNLEVKNLRRRVIFIFMLLVYFILPLFMLSQPLEANSHFIKTLRNVNERPGKYFECDRRSYTFENGKSYLNTLAGEDIELKGINLQTHETISVKGRFIDTNTAEVIDYHVIHFYSEMGLLMLVY